MSDGAAASTRTDESLRQCQLELATVREHNEQLLENEAAADHARDQLVVLAQQIDQYLTRGEWSPSGVRGWIKRRLVSSAASPQEAADAKELRRSALFDGAWYLAMYPDVVQTGLSPALHYLRFGASEGKDPGPDFSTKHYVAANPRLARSNTNPLLNHLRTGQ